jgi:hypothetical protein
MRLRHLQQGEGRVIAEAGQIRLERPASTTAAYSNAQIDEYGQGTFPYAPPCRLSLRARFSHPAPSLIGTAGFGFWNAPVQTGLRLPKVAWFFFGSPPLQIALAQDQRGRGFMAATMDAANWRFLALAPTAPLGFLLMRWPWFYRNFWPVGQAAIGYSEYDLDLDLTTPHHYALDCLPDRVDFWLDGQKIHSTPRSPRGPLGLVIWIDNQYAVVTPQGRFGWGLLACEESQWLEISDLEITSVPSSPD